MYEIEIGKKIKTLRTELGLTQKELTGGELTRNMLSRIENGSALPSVPTLLYLAGRLGVPAGFLLADNNEDIIYRKSAEIAKIRQAYSRKDYKSCLRYCELMGNEDPECERYISGCRFNLAKECFGCGELRQASELFSSIITVNSVKTEAPFPDGILNRLICQKSAVYLRCVSDISAAFAPADKYYEKYLSPYTDDPFAVYYMFYSPKAGFRRTDGEAETYISSRSDDESFYTGHIKARMLMKKNLYREACAILTDIAYGEKLIPQPVLLFMLSDLEICFRELSDFKSAYECAGLHRQLLDSFLADTVKN